MIRSGGGVSFGDKAAQAVAAGVIGIIFVNDGSEIIVPQLEKGRDPSTLSHVPAICVTKLVGERLDKLLRSHQILNDLPDGSGYVPGAENAIHIRWWDIAVGLAARRIQKRWKRLLSQRQLQGRLLQQDALLAEQAKRLWRKAQEAAAAEAEARHLESKSVSKIAWRRRHPRHPLPMETISQQQQRLAHQDAMLRERIAATGRAVPPTPHVAPTAGVSEKVPHREKREKASRKASMEAKSGRQWVDSLPLVKVEKQHAEVIEQRQRCTALQLQERWLESLESRGARISALQRELALARLARLTCGNDCTPRLQLSGLRH